MFERLKAKMEAICKRDPVPNDNWITRIEVIDDTGRAYVKHGVVVSQYLQDGGRTLKIFVNKKHG